MTPPTTPQPPTPTILKPLTGTWTQRCCACGKTYPQGVGSTQCCGSLGEVLDHRPEQPPTPITDAAIVSVDVAFVGHDGLSSSPQDYVEPDIARELETRLSTALARIAALEKALQAKYEEYEALCNEDDARDRSSFWVPYYRKFQQFIRDTLDAALAPPK